MRRYFLEIPNNVVPHQAFCGESIPALGSSSARVAFHPKGSSITVCEVTDGSISPTDANFQWDKSLLAMYYTGYRCTYMINQDTTELTDLVNTGLIDLGVYIDLTTADDIRNNIFTSLDTKITTATTRGSITPLTCSYSGGLDDYSDKLYTRFFGGRNSTHGNDTYSAPEGSANFNNSITCIKYLGKIDWISKSSTMRWLYYGDMNSVGVNNRDFISGSPSDGVIDLNNKIEDAFDFDGVFIGFGHWHWYEEDVFKTHLTSLNTAIGVRDVCKATFKELAVYQFIKDTIDSVSLVGSSLTVDYTIKDEERPYSDISTDLLWIEVNLAGTAFEGDFISCGAGVRIIEKSTDLYAIGFTLDFGLNQRVITISTAVDGSAYDVLTQPNVTVIGTNVTSDQAINYTLFRKTKAQNEWEIENVEYEASYSTSHTLPALDTANYDYYLGYSNEFQITGVETF